jgi:Flp pilus assembly protein TadD
VVALVAFAGPYFSAHDVAVANASGTSVDRSWTLLRHAKAFNPWNPAVPAAQGQLAENAHEFALAARLYGRAAELSRNAWAEEYARARALRSGGQIAAAKAACATARRLNPLEPLLERGACDFG